MRTYRNYLLLFLVLLTFSCKPTETKSVLDDYNIVWSSQSENSSESMPLVGGDIGCNVWVENGDIMLYVQRSGSLSENGEYLKMGRFRLRLTPNPFNKASSFRQELKVKDGYIELQSTSEKLKSTLVKLWVEVDNPVVHIDLESDDDIEVLVAYESWRTENKVLLDVPDGSRERFFQPGGVSGEGHSCKG